MAASISDYFNKASNMNGGYPPVATVSSARSAGGKTLSCDSLTGWATDTPVHFSTFKLASDGSIDTSTQTDWKGIVSGDTITSLKRIAGAADSGNAAGDRVELNPTIGWLDDLITGLLVAHAQDGSLKSSSVTSAKIASLAVTTAKIASKAVTADKIDFTTLPFKMASFESTTAVTTSAKTVATISSLPAGTYLAIMDAGFHQTGSSTMNLLVSFTPSSGTATSDVVAPVLGQNTSYWSHTCVVRQVILTATGSIALKLKGEAAFNFTTNEPHLYVMRVG